jgi:ankyrin repeat protein
LDARRLEFVTGDLNNIFMAAAESVTRLEALLNSPGCNPNVRDALGASPLWHACRAGSLECSRLLLERRADVQIQPRGKLSPLGVAARNGFIACVQLLLEHSANMEAIDDEQTTPLFAAVRGAHSSCVEVLVNARANLECKTKPLECTPLGWLCCVEPNLNLPILQMLLLGRANVDTYQFDSIARSMTPLAFAVLGERTDAVKWLLANGANVHAPDADGDPPVLLACISDHPDCCRILLSGKADANASRGESGTTLLNAAAHGESIECVQILLEHGAAQTINQMDRRGTHAMHWACQDKDAKILELLCKAKADVENKNGKGGSPLLLALTYDGGRIDNGLECLRILIEHKVDVNAIDDRNGMSPLGFAARQGLAEAAALLLKAGATATIGHMDHSGAHPMSWAAQEANPPLLKLLIEAKGNVEQRNGKGGTPLMLATCDPGPRNVECLRMLLKAKADPNQVDHEGDPAIIRTMMRDDEAQCAVLLEAGARANATDHHGISLVQRFGALAQPKMLRLLIQHGADVSDVLDLCRNGFSSGLVKKPAQDQNEVLQLLRDAPSVRARFLEEQRVKEQAERSQQEAEARRKAQEEEERRRLQEQAAAERRRADDRKVLVAWLRDTCRLPEDELVSVADIFLEVKFRTVSQIEALQGRNREDWPEKLSKGHRVSIDDAVLRTRQPPTPPAPPHGAGVRPDPPPPATISPGTQYDVVAPPKVQREATSSSSSSLSTMPSSQPPSSSSSIAIPSTSRAPSEASTASSSSREMVEVLAQRCHEPDADVEDVVSFFEAIKLQKYVPMLRERDVDGPLLLALVEQGMEALKELVPNNLDATKVCSKLKPRTTIMSSTSSSLPRPLLPKSESKSPKHPANYDLVKILGRGATGLTVLAVDKKSGQRVAIKRVEVDDDSQVSAYDASECV